MQLIKSIDDISIYFSGYNIREFAEVAIRSFLLSYPELRSRIYYFDDFSTDSTQDMLNNLGIKRITWSNKFENLYMEYLDSNILSRNGYSQMIRCEFIFKQILYHCNTKYLLILDGDTVTLKSGFIENYINSNSSAVGILGYRYKRVRENSDLLVSKYKELLYQKETVKHSLFGFDCLVFKRFHPYHLFLNLNRFGNIDSLINNLYDKEYINDFHNYIDVGSDILSTCISNNLNYSLLEIDEYIHHWSWISSSIRDCDRQCKLTDEAIITDVILRVRSIPILQDVILRTGISPRVLIKALKFKIRTGDYN